MRELENTGGVTRWVYSFGDGRVKALPRALELLGGKGAGLVSMTCIGLPVPPGFTITTQLCQWFYNHDSTFPLGLKQQLCAALGEVEHLTERCFGGSKRPLLLSVRSGARVSMPGMMDTVLDIGLNDKTVKGLAAEVDKRFAYDCYRRFIQMYSTLVLGMDHVIFENILDEALSCCGYKSEEEMTADNWQVVICRYKVCVEEEAGRPFPQQPQEQLWGAIRAVLASWMSARAVLYRNLHDIPEEWGTAVTVQAMVFGNMGGDSAVGVAFTRNPSTGEAGLHGEFLLNAQGEDVVSGIRSPWPVSEKARLAAGSSRPSLQTVMPAAFATLQAVAARLERHYRDVQDVEFTIEQGTLWLLQTRRAPCTALAALKIAVDMVRSGLISREEAVLRVKPATLQHFLSPVIDPAAERALIARGLPASSGVATGAIVFSSAVAQAAAAQGQPVILVRRETSPRDIHGMNAAQGILTTRGGVSSHAAAIARGMGKPCVCSASEICIAADQASMIVAGQTFRQGDFVTVDGSKGEVLAGNIALVQPVLPEEFAAFMQWVDSICHTGCCVDMASVSAPAERLAAVQIWLQKRQIDDNG